MPRTRAPPIVGEGTLVTQRDVCQNRWFPRLGSLARELSTEVVQLSQSQSEPTEKWSINDNCVQLSCYTKLCVVLWKNWLWKRKFPQNEEHFASRDHDGRRMRSERKRRSIILISRWSASLHLRSTNARCCFDCFQTSYEKNWLSTFLSTRWLNRKFFCSLSFHWHAFALPKQARAKVSHRFSQQMQQQLH